MRNMSFMLTTAAMRDRTKTVTRRLGWLDVRVGERIQACVKCQGRKAGEPLEKIGVIEVVDVRRERLWQMLYPPNGRTDQDEVDAEGFPHMNVREFIEFFCRAQGMIHPATEVTRIEFKHVDP